MENLKKTLVPDLGSQCTLLLMCLPDKKKDFNAIGSSSIHTNGKILLTVGTVDRGMTKNSELAMNKNSYYGKIIEIDKNQLNNSTREKLNLNIFSLGHRNPQGITKKMYPNSLVPSK